MEYYWHNIEDKENAIMAVLLICTPYNTPCTNVRLICDGYHLENRGEICKFT